MYKIIAKKRLNDVVEQMVIEAPHVTRHCEPGQFIILRIDDKGERIPLTIADFDRERGFVTIIYQMVGYTTRRLGLLQAGDYLEDFVGPLGRPAEFKTGGKILGIGGGVGIAPLYPQLKKAYALGSKVDVIIGARSLPYLILKEELETFCDQVWTISDDGSTGRKGFVTDILKERLALGERYDQVIAIGPLRMMQAVVAQTKPLNIPTSVSLNPIMIDGTGMCGGCRVTVGGETRFACVDGPDFDGFLVDFDECIRRQTMYIKEEKHKCRLMEGVYDED